MKWIILVAVLLFAVIGLMVFKNLRAPSLPILSTPVGSFTMEDLSLLERSTGDRLSIGMKKESVQEQFPQYKKHINKGHLQFMYDYNDEIEFLNALAGHKKFVTVRGIQNGDKQLEVLQRYGQGSYEIDSINDPATAYALFKEGETLTLIKDSESLADIGDETSIYVLYFFWTLEKHPKVKSIVMGQYSESLKDSKAEGIKRIRESLNIPDTAQEIVSLYDRYLEQAIVGHIQFANDQINFEKYQQLDKLSIQYINNLMNGLVKKDDDLYPLNFKKEFFEFMEEGKNLIQERSGEDRDSDKEVNRKFSYSFKEYRNRFKNIAEKFDCWISDDSYIDVQVGF